MTQVRSRLLTIVAAVSLIATAAVTSIAVPAALRAPPIPPVIATVDLEKALNNLNERTDAVAALKEYTGKLQGELTALGKELEDQQNKLGMLQGQAKKDAAVQLIQMRANAKVKKEVFEALIDQRNGEMLKALYEKVVDASKRLAKQNKYTMVVVSDESVQVPGGPSQDIERTISMKRNLYVDPAHDITGDIVTLMNNEYKAGVSAAPVTPGAPATK